MQNKAEALKVVNGIQSSLGDKKLMMGVVGKEWGVVKTLNSEQLATMLRSRLGRGEIRRR